MARQFIRQQLNLFSIAKHSHFRNEHGGNSADCRADWFKLGTCLYA